MFFSDFQSLSTVDCFAWTVPIIGRSASHSRLLGEHFIFLVAMKAAMYDYK